MAIKHNPKSRPRRLEEWKEIIEDWEKSGLSSHAYCKERKISSSTFSRGKNRVEQTFRKESYLKAEQEWSLIIKEWEQSGLELKTYCNEKKLNYFTFITWEKKLSHASQEKQKELLQKWERIMEDWRESNLSIRIYCKEKNIPNANFHIWKNKVTPCVDDNFSTRIFNKWTAIMEDWKKSGLQKTIYCREKGICYTVFLKWEKRFNPLWRPVWKESLEAQKEIVEDWRQTDLNMTDYCQEKKIKRNTFYTWRKREGSSVKEEISLRTLKKWTQLVEEWHISGLSRWAYCKKKGMHSPSFYKWERRLNPSRKPYQEELFEKQTATVEDWKKSGLSRHAYCLENELPCTFYFWERKYNSSALRKTAHEIAVEKWAPIIEDWEKSGLSKYNYCKAKGIANSHFYRWEKKLNPSRPSHSSSELAEEGQNELEVSLQDLFMPFALGSSVLGMSSPLSPRVEIILSQGHRLYLEGIFDWKKLASWLASLLKR